MEYLAAENDVANVKLQSSVQLVQSIMGNIGVGNCSVVTKELAYGTMDQLVEGFKFIISITDAKKIPFSEAYQISALSGMELIGVINSVINACVWKMLNSVDQRDYPTASHLSEILPSVAK